MSKCFVIVCSYAPSLVNFRGELLKQIKQNGHRIVAVAPDFDSKIRLWCRSNDIETEDFQLNNQGMNPFRDLVSIYQLYQIIRKYNADVVLGYTHKPALYTAFAGFLARVPHVTMMVTGLGFGFETDSLKKKIVNSIVKMMFYVTCLQCDRIIFHNKDNLQFFIQSKIVKDETKCTVVAGSGIDLSQFSRLEFSETKNSNLVFLLIARIVRYKGIIEYATAAQSLKKKYPDSQFLLVGYRDNNPASYDDEEWKFITQNVTYMGKSDKIAEMIRLAHVYVLPSYGEGLPRTVLEAMASGRAIITADSPGCRDTVIENRNGHLVQVKDSKSLANAMERFLSGNSDWRRMGDESYKMALQLFDVKQVNRQMIDALKLGQTGNVIGGPNQGQ